jgi:hypothetical protein
VNLSASAHGGAVTTVVAPLGTGVDLQLLSEVYVALKMFVACK